MKLLKWYMPEVGRFLGADPLAEKFAYLGRYIEF